MTSMILMLRYSILTSEVGHVLYDAKRDADIDPGAYQQTTSGLTTTDQDCYEQDKACFSVYGFEYLPGFDNGYITWISNDTRVWTVYSAGLSADPLTEIGPRPIPQEPMVCSFFSLGAT